MKEMPEMKYKDYEKKNNENLPQKLSDLLNSEVSIWTNDACYGYVLMAMKDAKFSAEDIQKVLQSCHYYMDIVSVEQAEQYYHDN